MRKTRRKKKVRTTAIDSFAHSFPIINNLTGIRYSTNIYFPFSFDSIDCIYNPPTLRSSATRHTLMTALKPTSTLYSFCDCSKDIFGDVNYAWDLLEAEVRMETA